MSYLVAASMAFLTGVFVLSPVGPNMSAVRTYSPAHVVQMVQTPVHRTLAELFAPKSLIIIPAPASQAPTQPSAFDLEQGMSYGQLMHRWNPMIADAAKRFGVPAAWIRAVMQLESGGRTMLGENQPIVSHAGAMGLMQLMPDTYNDMKKAYHLGSNPFDPRDNIMAGAAYLRFLHGKYAYPAMFEAYNDGPGHLEERLKSGNMLPAETELYVANITKKLDGRAIGSRGDMTKLTRPDGLPVWVNAVAAVGVRAPLPGEYSADVHAVICFGKHYQGVRETVAAVTRTLRSHGSAV
jgi:hypothetical protein